MNKKSLKGLEEITEFLRIIFASGNIEEKPLSVILVAPVSSGKTTAIKQFRNNKNILITTDSTAWGILRNYQNQLKNGEIRHIIIPDLYSALARKKTTSDQLILFINNSSEDGIFPSVTFGTYVSEYIKPFGWVLCLTEDGFKRKYRFLKEIGFISRFFVIKYKYTLEQIHSILQDVIREINYYDPPTLKIKYSKKLKKVRGNPKIFEELGTYSKLLCKESEAEIIRMQKKLQIFLKANAYLHNRSEVTDEDMKKLKQLIHLIQ